MRFLDKLTLECFVIVLWNIWNARNNLVFKGSMVEPRLVWDRAAQFNHDFRIHNLFQPAMIPLLKWTKPLHGFLKINFDAAWVKNKVAWVLSHVMRKDLFTGVVFTLSRM